MQKRLFGLVMAILVLAMFAACSDSEDEHTDTAFLIGSWAKEGGGASFTISAGLVFECGLAIPANEDGTLTALAGVSGKLVWDASNLGPDDYIMKDLAPVNDKVEYAAGNAILATMPVGLSSMEGDVITLKPSAAKDSFVFSSENPISKNFFGGTFYKLP